MDEQVSARSRSGEEKRRATRQRKLSRPRCRLDCSSHLRLQAGKKEKKKKKREKGSETPLTMLEIPRATQSTGCRCTFEKRQETNQQLRVVWPSSMTPRFRDFSLSLSLSLYLSPSSWENGMSPLRAEMPRRVLHVVLTFRRTSWYSDRRNWSLNYRSPRGFFTSLRMRLKKLAKWRTNEFKGRTSVDV